MNERIEPALSREEWAAMKVLRGDWKDGIDAGISDHPDAPGLYIGNPVDDSYSYHNDAPSVAAIIALANHALPDDDPRKITREWIGEILYAANECRRLSLDASRASQERTDLHVTSRKLQGIADALESYLPPEV